MLEIYAVETIWREQGSVVILRMQDDGKAQMTVQSWT
jgi:hypothetical protein